MESVPHIYLSCLPHIPMSSRIPMDLPEFSNLAKVKTGRGTAWNSHVTVFEGHSDEVWCVSYAPIGSLIASGSKDKTVRVLDPIMGNLVVLRKHTDAVSCMAFSPDAKRLVSGS